MIHAFLENRSLINISQLSFRDLTDDDYLVCNLVQALPEGYLVFTYMEKTFLSIKVDNRMFGITLRCHTLKVTLFEQNSCENTPLRVLTP